ncbi:hypothetical protein [Paracoccus sp. S-4012]|uniref:hypothetical protein n=1 Tax=Paracoccus sp. S-4012 TaxID=2665648 RepID=UPI001E5A35BB|nr:hypothetical protein [Paracoccus sp. S-4012]
MLDELLKGCTRPEDLLGDAGLMKELKVRLMVRMLGAELTAHRGYEAGAEPPPEQANRRNGTATKRVKGSDGERPAYRCGTSRLISRISMACGFSRITDAVLEEVRD